MKLKVIGSILVVATLSVIALFMFGSLDSLIGGTPSNKTIAMEEVAKHKTAKSCWIVLSNNVYDVTKFVKMHPGGKHILKGCGKDATTFFNTRPMGSGTKHSATAHKMREKYKIGKLK